MKGREREAQRIKKAVRASTMGRLLLGEVKSWQEFLEADVQDWRTLPRPELRALDQKVRKHLKKEIGKFCGGNFDGMTEDTLAELYEEVKARRGLEIPLADFQERYCAIRPEVMRGHPSHLTIVISIWGMQFMYPEDLFAKDIRLALRDARSAKQELDKLRSITHEEAKRKREDVAGLVARIEYASRTCVLSCFNLVEAYLNGIAWQFARNEHRMTSLSNRKRNLIQDTGRTSIRDKILKYPEIITGRALWAEGQDPANAFLEDVKAFRDSLVHPSPFTTPDRFGGRDKLQTIYRLNIAVARRSAKLATEIVDQVYRHINGAQAPSLRWLSGLMSDLADDS